MHYNFMVPWLQTCVLFVDLKFKSKEDVQKFREVFTPMTQYVKENEAGHTYAYKLLTSEDSPLHLTIYERHGSAPPLRCRSYRADSRAFDKDHCQMSIWRA